MRCKPLFGKQIDNLVTEDITTHSTYCHASTSQTGRVIGKVGGCSTECLACGEHIPKYLPKSYNLVSHNHLLHFIYGNILGFQTLTVAEELDRIVWLIGKYAVGKYYIAIVDK